MSDFDVTVDGPVMHSCFEFKKDGIAQGFDTLVYGLGYAVTALRIEQLGIHARVILFTTHVRHIYEKLEVRSRGSAVYEAVALGLIRLDD